MVQSLVILSALLTLTQNETPIPKSEASVFADKAMIFLKKAERGVLETPEYPPIDKSLTSGYRINDLSNAFLVYVKGANFEYHRDKELVQFARLPDWKSLRLNEPALNVNLAIDRSKIEPLINQYAQTAGYPGSLKVRNIRQTENPPYAYQVNAIPVYRDVPYSSVSSVLFELDYRNGRIYLMRLYGFPKPPATLTPHRTLEESRIEVLQKLFAKYDIPGVEEADFKLAIAGLAPPVENDDAVKYSQRVWDVQGQLVYEARFKHINTFGEGRTPVRIYRAMIDANTNEIISLNEAAPGTLPRGKNEPTFSLSGPITVVVEKTKKTVKAGNLEASTGTVSDQAKGVLLIGKVRAFKAKFDPKSGLLSIDGKTFKPGNELRKSLKGI